jgi:D-xylulose reductase
VREPLILGHEASGEVMEVGGRVTHLKPGDRVCMEPGIPNPRSKASREGMYNVDPDVIFWGTPPVHGVTRPSVVHPADYCYKLPDSVSFEEGAMVEPLAIGMHAAKKAAIKPGDIAVVTGAGTIGLVTAIAALGGGCSRVIITDVLQPKLDIAAAFGAVTPVNISKEDPLKVISDLTGGWGADIVFEASGASQAAATVFDMACPGGRVVYIGMPVKPVSLDIVKAQTKEISVETIYRYANVYDRAVKLIGSGRIDVKPLITDKYDFEDSIKAYDYAVDPRATSVKTQILL